MNRKKILVVDDDPSVLTCYERLLKRSGYLPVTLSDGRELEASLEDHADAGLLILDYRMPLMDGLSLLSRLRDKGFRCPVLLVSAYATEEVRVNADRLGVCRVLEKPVGTGHLLSSIREFMDPSSPEAA